jgi:hypothetical protein
MKENFMTSSGATSNTYIIIILIVPLIGSLTLSNTGFKGFYGN